MSRTPPSILRRRGIPRLARLVLPALIACLSSISRAEDPADARARAVQLTSEGAAAYKAEEFAQAVDKFSAAYRLYLAAPLLLNLSRAELKLSRCAEAIHHAEMFKSAVGDTLATSADAPEAWLTTVQRSCIEAVVHSSPPGATIWIDGERQTSPDSTPWKGRLTVGSHKVLLWRDGFEETKAYLDVSSDAPAHLELTLVLSGAKTAVILPPTPRPVEAPRPTPPISGVQHPAPPVTSVQRPARTPAPAPLVAAAQQSATASTPPMAEAPRQKSATALPVAEPPHQAVARPPPVQLLPTPQPESTGEVTAKKISRPVLRNLGYAGIAVGGAALIAAVVLAVTVKENTLGLGQRTGQRTTAQANSDFSTGQAEASSVDALFVVGGVFAAAGIPLVVVF